MRILLSFFILSFTTLSAQAQSRWSMKFEPLYGVEHVTNRYPEPARSTTRSFLGLRVLGGVPLLSGELEGTTAQDDRSYPGENQKVKDQVSRVSLGLRTTVPTTTWLAFFARAGGRGTWEKHEITDTQTGVTEEKSPPMYVDPYAGAGIQLAVGPLFAVSAGATWFFTDGKPDVQYSLGGTMKFGETR